MLKRLFCSLAVVIGVAGLVGCDDGGAQNPNDTQSMADGTDTQTTPDAADTSTGGDVGPVTLSGAVHKGPFVLGSTVNVSPTDASGNPTGDVFNTQTTSDLGQFEVQFTYTGLVALEGSGFYYNEITGELSDAELTLRAFAEITASGTQDAYINIVTHLSANRIKKLLEGGTDFATARDQAESELRAALAIGPTGFDPGAPGTDMNLLGGDNDANAYVFAVSAVLADAAKARVAATGGSPDANLQELLNQISLDLSDDGQLQANRVDEIEAAEQRIQTDRIEALLQARLDTIGSTATVPDLDRVIDQDGDGVPNGTDTCPRVANMDQMQAVDDICNLVTYTTAEETFDPFSELGATDLTGDGNEDLVALRRSEEFIDGLRVLPGAAMTELGTPIDSSLSFSNPDAIPDSRQPVDYDGDGDIDYVLAVQDPSSTGALPIFLLRNDGSGALSQESLDVPNQPDVGGYSFDSMRSAVALDLNADSVLDLVTISGNNEVLAVSIGNSDGTWDVPTVIAWGGGADQRARRMHVADIDGDDDDDVIVWASEGATSTPAASLFVLRNDGSGMPAVEGPVTTGLTGLGFAQTGLGDFDGDGAPDVFAFDFSGGGEGSGNLTIGTLMNDGSGGFGGGLERVFSPDLTGNMSWALGDFDADDVTDLVILYDDNQMAVYFSDPANGFVEKAPIRLADTLRHLEIAAGDFNGDTRDDLAIRTVSVSMDNDVTSWLTVLYTDP